MNSLSFFKLDNEKLKTMVQANELRLGNWVNFMEDDTQFQVDEISTSGLGVKNNIEETWIELDQFSGIKITEDVLLKCGFKRQIDNKSLFFLSEYRYSMHGGFITMLRGCDKHGESEPHACGFPFITDTIPCRELHKLQNLYFALSGTELPYTP